MEGIQQTNLQLITNQSRQGLKCFFCKKMRHVKAECRKRPKYLEKLSQQNDKTAQQNTQVDDSNVPQQEDVFEHLFQHASNAQQTINHHRFLGDVQVDDQQVDTLFDTGSTCSSISEAVAYNLNLKVDETNNATAIQYGNNTVQITRRTALLSFTTQGRASSANLLVVPQQSQALILGMDWMEREDVLLHPVLKQLKKAGLKINLKKYQWFQGKVKFLGYIVSNQSIKADPSKTAAVRNWPTPTNPNHFNDFLVCAHFIIASSNLSQLSLLRFTT